jgi:hypothetical protein
MQHRSRIVDGPRTLKERHLKIAFSQDGRRVRAIAWRAAERAGFLEKHRTGVNLAFSLERNEFQGNMPRAQRRRLQGTRRRT